MVLLPLVPRPLGRVRLLMHALHAHSTSAAGGAPAAEGAPPAGGAQPAAPDLPPVGAPPSPAGCEAAGNDEDDAALALRFGFHV
jgi:hypothetical protein